MQSQPSTRTSQDPVASDNRTSFSTWILVSCVGGIAAGVFFGEFCERLAIVGDIFVGLLRMTVLPYIIVTLVANLGRLSMRASRRLALSGGLVLLLLWSMALCTVFALANTFPVWKGGSFFSTALTEEPQEFNFVDVFIPSNIFSSLSQNQVPAVVVLCVCCGLVLSGLKNRQLLISQLDIVSKVLLRITRGVTRLTPIGVFAIAATTAGTVSMEEIGRLQAYLIAYSVGALFLGLFVLPIIVKIFTPFQYRDVMSVSKDAMVLAFVTGKLIVVLPLLIENTEKLFAKYAPKHEDEDVTAVDVLYPTAYAFPHVGKLLSMLFIPFAAWFLGNSLQWHEYPTLLSSGLFSYFSGPLVAVPFLLDLMHLPHDMFQLFLLTGVYGERLGDAVGAMHLTVLALITTCYFRGNLRLSWMSVVKFTASVTIAGFVVLIGLRLTLGNMVSLVQADAEVFENMQSLAAPVDFIVLREAIPNPEPLKPGETLLNRIRRRGVIRVGYNEDKLPFAFFNARGELVGHDVEMAHALARDLGVTIEFVRFDRVTLARQLADDDFDIVMSGLVGTLERSESMQHTSPYMDVTLALVVPDHRVRDFRSLDALRKLDEPRIGFVDLSRGFVSRLQLALPGAKLVELGNNQQFFASDWKRLDALLVSAETGSAFTLLHPEFEVVVPLDLGVRLPLFYAIGGKDDSMKEFVEHWVALRRKDGTMQELYDRWILGKAPSSKTPRWSIVRDVLHWVD